MRTEGRKRVVGQDWTAQRSLRGRQAGSLGAAHRRVSPRRSGLERLARPTRLGRCISPLLERLRRAGRPRAEGEGRCLVGEVRDALGLAEGAAKQRPRITGVTPGLRLHLKRTHVAHRAAGSWLAALVSRPPRTDPSRGKYLPPAPPQNVPPSTRAREARSGLGRRSGRSLRKRGSR